MSGTTARNSALTDARAATAWLLALGSNLEPAEAVAVLASAERLLAVDAAARFSGPTLQGADVGGGLRPYLNKLLIIESELPVDQWIAHLKQIERDLGRSPERQADGWCDIDIDLLARIDEGEPQWLSTKPLQIPAVQHLVTERFGAAALPATLSENP